jgi:hypothetical protein
VFQFAVPFISSATCEVIVMSALPPKAHIPQQLSFAGNVATNALEDDAMSALGH